MEISERKGPVQVWMKYFKAICWKDPEIHRVEPGISKQLETWWQGEVMGSFFIVFQCHCSGQWQDEMDGISLNVEDAAKTYLVSLSMGSACIQKPSVTLWLSRFLLGCICLVSLSSLETGIALHVDWSSGTPGLRTCSEAEGMGWKGIAKRFPMKERGEDEVVHWKSFQILPFPALCLHVNHRVLPIV